MMNSKSKTNNDAGHWIYITVSKEKRYKIEYSSQKPELDDSINAEIGKSPIYIRKFEKLIDALGHKLFLEQISDTSIERIIKMRRKETEKY